MVTETTTQSWTSRVGASFKGILVGVAFVVASVCALFWNEGRTIKRAKALDEAANVVVPIESKSINADNEGKLVYLTGDAVSEDTLQDPFFNVSVNAIKLMRTVEMYQWQEKVESRTERGSNGKEVTTKTYSYTQCWSETKIDSSNFKEAGHNNPYEFPVESEEFIAKHVTLGAFTMSPSLINSIVANEEFVPETSKNNQAAKTNDTTEITPNADSAAADDDDQAPGDLYEAADVESEYQAEFVVDEQIAGSELGASGFKPHGKGFYKGNPTAPQIGDIRVTYKYVPSPTTVSVVSQQQGNTFVPYQAKTGSVELLNIGIKSVDQMFEKAQKDNRVMCWIIRFAGFFFMLIGFNAIFKPLAVIADFLPFVGRIVGAGTGFVAFCLSLCISLATIAIGWLTYRPLISIPLLVVAVAALVYPIIKGKKQSAQS